MGRSGLMLEVRRAGNEVTITMDPGCRLNALGLSLCPGVFCISCFLCPGV